MAKTVSNKQGKSGRSNGKPGKGKPPARRAEGKPARRQASRQPARAPKEKRGFGKFLHDVRVEMSKVTWPTRRDLAQSTLVVLVAVGIAALYVAVLDEVFTQIVDRVVGFLT